MLNGNRLATDFLKEEEIKILYDIGLFKNDNLEKAFRILVKYINKLGYEYFEAKPKTKRDEKYLNLINRIYDLLPIYGTPANLSHKNICFYDE